MAAGAEVTQTLESSASTYTGGIEGRNIGGNTPEVYFSAVTNKKPATRATARRSSVASADSTASLVAAGYIGSNNFDCENSMMAALSCRFSAASQSATVFFALYDANDNLIGVTRDYSFQGDATFTDGTLYISSAEIVDLHAASQYYPILRTAPASGTVDIFVEHL